MFMTNNNQRMKGGNSQDKQAPFSGLPFTQSRMAAMQNQQTVGKQRPASLERSSSNARSKRSTEELTSWLTCRNTNIDIRKKLMEACRSPVYARKDLRIENSFEPEADIELGP